MAELVAQKKAIRKQILAARAGLDGARRADWSQKICKTIASLPDYQDARSILFFMPFGDEVDISPLLSAALGKGVLCALPRCYSASELKLYRVSNLETDLEPGRWGIREPKDCLNERTVHDFSVIIVPGVAFDRAGHRLGYGAGYYDRILAKARALTIAPAFSVQVLQDLPYGSFDVPVQIIVTQDEIIDCLVAGE